jgi:choline-sulfatase
MAGLGYRTFGIGKFHTQPWDEDLGYQVHLHSEELYATVDQRQRDAYAKFIADNFPYYRHVEQLQGERTEMYYMPQTSPFPAEVTVEAWAADRAVEQISAGGTEPYFGFVSFIGPHPPFAPPVPFNRLYDPDRMPNPRRGDPSVDHMDEQIPWMNELIWANDISDAQARVLRARYYGEITYIDECLGRILDAVEARGDAQDTLICFFADHGDHMGDHNAWQKESFFEQACHVPFLVSWPSRLPAGETREELAALTDLFGIATRAAGSPQPREGADLLGIVDGSARPRDYLIGYYGEPGSPQLKLMVRRGDWKYIYIANGGREQLFNLREDPFELTNRIGHDETDELRGIAVAACRREGAEDALDGDSLRSFPFQRRPARRIYQFDASRGITGFPERPEDVLKAYRSATEG